MKHESDQELEFERLGGLLGRSLGDSHDEARLNRQRERFAEVDRAPRRAVPLRAVGLASAALAAAVLIAVSRSPAGSVPPELGGPGSASGSRVLAAGEVVVGDPGGREYLVAGSTSVTVHEGARLRAGGAGKGCLQLERGRIDLSKSDADAEPCTLNVGPYTIDMPRARGSFEFLPDQRLVRVEVSSGVLELRLGESDEVMLLREGDSIELEHQPGPVPEPQPDAHIDPARVADGSKDESRPTDEEAVEDARRGKNSGPPSGPKPSNDAPAWRYDPPAP